MTTLTVTPNTINISGFNPPGNNHTQFYNILNITLEKSRNNNKDLIIVNEEIKEENKPGIYNSEDDNALFSDSDNDTMYQNSMNQIHVYKKQYILLTLIMIRKIEPMGNTNKRTKLEDEYTLENTLHTKPN